MKNDNVNFNVTDQYVQASRGIGSTTYYNVNTNTSIVVPWGSLDWFNQITGSALSLAVTIGLIYFIGHWAKFF